MTPGMRARREVRKAPESAMWPVPESSFCRCGGLILRKGARRRCWECHEAQDPEVVVKLPDGSLAAAALGELGGAP